MSKMKNVNYSKIIAILNGLSGTGFSLFIDFGPRPKDRIRLDDTNLFRLLVAIRSQVHGSAAECLRELVQETKTARDGAVRELLKMGVPEDEIERNA